MRAMASQITSLMIVYSTVYAGTDERKYQNSASLAFVRGIHRWPVNSPHKELVTRKIVLVRWKIMLKIYAVYFVVFEGVYQTFIAQNWMWHHVVLKTFGNYDKVMPSLIKNFTYDSDLPSLNIVHVHDDIIKWKHFPRCWPFVRGIHRLPVNSPHKGQWSGALMFSLIFDLPFFSAPKQTVE